MHKASSKQVHLQNKPQSIYKELIAVYDNTNLTISSKFHIWLPSAYIGRSPPSLAPVFPKLAYRKPEDRDGVVVGLGGGGTERYLEEGIPIKKLSLSVQYFDFLLLNHPVISLLLCCDKQNTCLCWCPTGPSLRTLQVWRSRDHLPRPHAFSHIETDYAPAIAFTNFAIYIL